jgi:hypothetical protein
MFSDPFYQTHNSEVFVQTQCIQHEHAVNNLLSSILTLLGYSRTNELNRQWIRRQKKDFWYKRQQVAVSLADSFGLCGNQTRRPEQWFDKNDVIITDNHVLFEPEYTVYQTPSSYFGIYHYVPVDQEFRPNRRFGLSINRFDSQRQMILLELLRQSNGIDCVLEKDYVNFNVRDPAGDNSSVNDILNSFSNAWKIIH